MEKKIKSGHVYIIRFSNEEQKNLRKACMTRKTPEEVIRKQFGDTAQVELSLFTSDIVSTKRSFKEILQDLYHKDHGYDWFDVGRDELMQFFTNYSTKNVEINVDSKVESVGGQKLTEDGQRDLNTITLLGDMFFVALLVLVKIFFSDKIEPIFGEILFDQKNYIETPFAKTLYKIFTGQ